MGKIRILTATLFILPVILLTSFSQQNNAYPLDVEATLRKAGKNRGELEKAITYFRNSKSSLKLKAIYFLISNMDIHYSTNYRWINEKGKAVAFNELIYKDFNTAILRFNELKKDSKSLSPKVYIYKDIDSIKSTFLIKNVNLSFQIWNVVSPNVSFNDFCEYILPYRVTDEPLQDWRHIYQQKFSWIVERLKKSKLEDVLTYVAVDERNWFKDTWGDFNRSEPLPHLSALQLLFRKQGRCEDIANLEVFTLRSQGIPAALNVVPYWATSSDSHFFNTAFTSNFKPISFDVTRTPAVNVDLMREPSKVIRITYSKQPGTLSSFEPIKTIPPGFMRARNYIDVTHLFWQTAELKSPLFRTSMPSRIVYAAVFNKLDWKPTWWAEVKNNTATFTNMCKGVVYLPIYYINNTAKPAGYPVALGYNHTQLLKPDVSNKRNIIISPEEKRLILQTGKTYKLYYWDNQWKICGQKTAYAERGLFFNNVPKNALLLLVPEYSQGKERPFVITEDQKRIWF